MNKIFNLMLMLAMAGVTLFGNGCASNGGGLRVISWNEFRDSPTYHWGRNDLPLPRVEYWYDAAGGIHEHDNTADGGLWKHDRDCEKQDRGHRGSGQPANVNIVQQGNGNVSMVDNRVTINNNTINVGAPAAERIQRAISQGGRKKP